MVGTLRNPQEFFQQALKNLKPGGWMELVDMTPEGFSDDNTLQSAPHIIEWGKLVDEASIKFGKRINIPHLYKQWMEDAGFKNVREEVYKVCTSLTILW
jgi:hypothetical protein